MEARAQARFVRVAPSKARRVVDVVRGMQADEAVAVLRFAPQAAAEPVRKVIESAVANAVDQGDVNPETMYIQQIYVDEGPTLRRYRPRAQGRAFRIRKRTSHITVIVAERSQQAAGRRSGAGSKGGAR